MEKEREKTSFQKKWENYWYYYKWHTVIAIFAIIVVAISLQQCMARVQPDVSVVIATQKTVLSPSDQEKFQSYIASLSSDVNRDGKKSASCQFLVMGGSGQYNDMNSAMLQKLQVEMAAGDSIIYITDDAVFTKLNDQKFFDNLQNMIPNARNVTANKLPVENTTLSSQSFGKNLAGLNVSVRVFKGTTLDKPKNQSNYQNSLRIVKKLAGVQ